MTTYTTAIFSRYDTESSTSGTFHSMPRDAYQMPQSLYEQIKTEKKLPELKPQPRRKENTPAQKKELSSIAQVYNDILLHMSTKLRRRISETGMSVCMSQTHLQDSDLQYTINNTRGVTGIYLYEQMLIGKNFPRNHGCLVLMIGLTKESLDANLFRMFYPCQPTIFMTSISPGLLGMCQELMTEAGLLILGTAQTDKNEEYETFMMKCKWSI